MTTSTITMDFDTILQVRRPGRPKLSPEERKQRERERLEANKEELKASKRRYYLAKVLADPNHKFKKQYTEEDKQAALDQKARGKGATKKYTPEQRKQVNREVQNQVRALNKQKINIICDFITTKRGEFVEYLEQSQQ